MGTKSAGWRMGPAMCIATLAFWGGLAQAEVTNPDGIAVIIGNKNYHHTEDVDFAHRDAEEFKRYVVDVLGFDPNRIEVLRDAGLHADEVVVRQWAVTREPDLEAPQARSAVRMWWCSIQGTECRV